MTTKIETAPTEVEPDSYELSRRLQEKGVSAISVVRDILGYNVTGSDGEAYATCRVTGDNICITEGSEGVSSIHAGFGKYTFNMVDFVLAHESKLSTALEAAKYICSKSQVADTASVMAPVEPKVVVPRELDLNYAASKNLQDQNLPLHVIAANLGFKVIKPTDGDELYVYSTPNPDLKNNPQHAFVAAIARNKDGVEIAHYPAPVNGRTQASAMRFAMDHGGKGYESPLAARASLGKMLAAQTPKVA